MALAYNFNTFSDALTSLSSTITNIFSIERLINCCSPGLVSK
jgi:hypothetical protein